MSPADHKTDLRLRRKYGIGLEEYNRMLAEQGGVCNICWRSPGTRRLNVDHDHKVSKYRVRITRSDSSEWKFIASAVGPNGIPCFLSVGNDRKALRERVLLKLKRHSVRGLLCHLCNRSLVLLGDDPARLRSAADYLEAFAKRRAA